MLILFSPYKTQDECNFLSQFVKKSTFLIYHLKKIFQKLIRKHIIKASYILEISFAELNFIRQMVYYVDGV
jgi:hypothetical protein